MSSRQIRRRARGDWLDLVPELAMFPLGSLLFPHMPLRLQVFEPRYLQMLAELIEARAVRFGVVLIERGTEVGGGEQRFDVGTVAEVDRPRRAGRIGRAGRPRRITLPGARLAGGRAVPAGRGGGAPGPGVVDGPASRCAIRPKQLVRRTLAKASEFADNLWPSDIELSDDPVAAAWQLAAIAPLTALDQLKLLGASSMAELLGDLLELTRDAAAGYS